MNDHPPAMNATGEDEPPRSSGADDVPAPPFAVIELELAAPQAWPLPEDVLQKEVERAAAAALAQAAADGAVVERNGVPPRIEVLLGDDETICQLNARWRGKDAPTNVLSFPAPAEMPFIPDVPWPLGSLALAGGVMRQEAEARGVSLQEHLCWMVIHGILHLLGHDHEEDDEAVRMEALERRALAQLGLADPYAGT